MIPSRLRCLIVLIVGLFSGGVTYAQETIPASGGDAMGTGG